MQKTEKPFVEVNNLYKVYDGFSSVLDNVSLEIARGEIACIFGPNGCGKTTLLKIIAGIDKDYQGKVLIGGKSPIEVRTGIVPQDYDMTLLPWRNTVDNITLPLEVNGYSRRVLREIVVEFLKKMGIKLPLLSPVYKLSGGQKQLTVIARTLINKPEFLVMDEPFASLDSSHFFQIADVLKRIWNLTEVSTVLVTHDLVTAVLLSDQIFLFSPKPGRIVHCEKISLPEPRSVSDPLFVETVNYLQGVFLMGGE
ncbi:MAG: ABC transporter ATP-binding protein [Anaerolineaceae bacterium]|jgi:NitT/TauT family transport system ATP-binding protein|nr:ABC transporter ATP-binding protein [Anaerolineaceae bacterium]MDD4042886.1 ABC transporter ATP-binding protein [Anaerolineaceae bacterium]MDD4577122.1 ABC transporter ATP-binding protein [Anaerolineaceae bacterium]